MYISDVLSTKFPEQEHVSGSSKIPTVLYYDKDGTVRAVDAETLTDGIYEMAEEGGQGGMVREVLQTTGN